MVRYRSINAPLCANWGLANGGLHPLSKADFSKLFPKNSNLIPACKKLPAGMKNRDALEVFKEFEKTKNSAEPRIILKPDDGVQGRAIQIIEGEDAFLKAWKTLKGGDGFWLLQEFIEGFEVSLFYVRDHPETSGRLISMTRKQGFTVMGDGHRTIAELIAMKDADQATKKRVSRFNQYRLDRIPGCDEEIQLIYIANHHLGATFHDISEYLNEKIEKAVVHELDQITGYQFGRLDVRAPSFEHLIRGKDIKILEVNSLYSEPIHAYDPKYSLFDAIKIFLSYWNLAFKIGLANKRAGKPQISPMRIIFPKF